MDTEGRYKLAGKQLPKWIERSKAARVSLRAPLGSKPWSSQAKLLGVTSAREVELLDIAWIAHCNSHSEDPNITGARRQQLARDLVVDVSQAVERRPWRVGMKTFTTSAMMYAYRLDRVLTPQEAGVMLGHAPQVFRGLCEGEVRSLVGEAMALPCCGAGVAALFIGCDFPDLLD